MKRLTLSILFFVAIVPFALKAEDSNAKYTDEQMLEREYSEIPSAAVPAKKAEKKKNAPMEAGMGFGGFLSSEPAVQEKQFKAPASIKAPTIVEPEAESEAGGNRVLMGPDY